VQRPHIGFHAFQRRVQSRPISLDICRQFIARPVEVRRGPEGGVFLHAPCRAYQGAIEKAGNAGEPSIDGKFANIRSARQLPAGGIDQTPTEADHCARCIDPADTLEHRPRHLRLKRADHLGESFRAGAAHHRVGVTSAIEQNQFCQGVAARRIRLVPCIDIAAHQNVMLSHDSLLRIVFEAMATLD